MYGHCEKYFHSENERRTVGTSTFETDGRGWGHSRRFLLTNLAQQVDFAEELRRPSPGANEQ